MRIALASGVDEVLAAADLFDEPPRTAATEAFLADPGHHLLLARDDGEAAVGFVTGVETTHPDKGTEMLLYELGVAPHARRAGVATALVRALARLATERGCYAMWVPVDTDNEAALATYRRAGADAEETFVSFGWDLASKG